MIERLQCPICRQAAAPVFARPYSHAALQAIVSRAGLGAKLDGKAYEIRRCPACDLWFQTWVMEDAELECWYSPPRDRASFMEEIGRQRLHWFAHLTEEILVMRQLVAEPVPVVLDFGCNWGKWASMALAHGCEVFAVDVNRDAAAFCASRGIRMLGYDELPGLRFDFVNVDQVAEHLGDPLNVVRHLAACVKPGGFLKLATPGNARLPRQLGDAQARRDDSVLDAATLDSLLPLEHVNLFTGRSLVALARAAGLEPALLPFGKWLGAGQLWNLPRQLNRNLVVPFKRAFGTGIYRWFQKPATLG